MAISVIPEIAASLDDSLLAMTNTIKTIFFGSTSDSVIALNKLFNHTPSTALWAGLQLVCVVTQPPRPAGRNKSLTPTPTEQWAKEHHITVLSFPSDPEKPNLYSDEQVVIDTLAPFQADLLVSASYGQKIPLQTITRTRFGGLNVHPSLLPRWRGADPVPWAILTGDRQIGVTVVTLSEQFDQGKIIAQKKITLSPADETDPLRAKLFDIGADLLLASLPDYLSGKNPGTSQFTKFQHVRKTEVYARRLTRDDGYIPWNILEKALSGEDVPMPARPAVLALDASHITITIAKALRALLPWPGLWTRLPSLGSGIGGQAMVHEKRLKILACHTEAITNKLILDIVQLEGKKPVPYAQFASAYLHA